ncbi:TPA: cell division protein FtsK [Clostridium perfringens]|nr:cell division protein FtsK [Clostridium perfringens]
MKLLELIKAFFIHSNSREEWKRVRYPPSSKPILLRIIPMRICVLLISIILETYLIVILSDLLSFGIILQISIGVLYCYLIYKTIFLYKSIVENNKKNKNKQIENSLKYIIQTNKLYDEEIFEVEEVDRNGRIKVKKEKRIVRTIRIFYKEDDIKVYIRVAKDGDRFVKEAPNLGEFLESALGLELDSVNSNVNYVEYILLKEKDKRIDLRERINNQNNNLDVINISGNISYRLSKTPHSLIVGGTGSGKSFFILGKIVSYLSLTPQAELYIVDPKKADLSLLRFVQGMEDRVATEPNQIAKMLREVVEIMEERYSTYFNDISAFGKDYTDFGLPPVILIFDEFSAFIHSVDKKLSKEVLDYVFSVVMKGRQSGVIIEILMQRPDGTDLPTNIRAQMGFKAGLGAMDKIGYNMIFNTNDVDFKTVTEKGGGYIQIDGVHTAPVYFETPYIDKDFDFIQEITKLIQNKKQ